MRKEQLFEAIGEIDDTLIAKSGKRVKRKNKAMFRTVLATAACMAVLFGAVFAMNRTGLLKPVQPDTEQTEPGSHGIPGTPSDDVGTGLDDPDITYAGPSIINGGEGEDVRIEYNRGMDPADEFIDVNPGPLMPMTLAQANSTVTAQRDMTYDFSSVTKESNGYVAIKDSYELKNTSNTDQTVTLLYPYLNTIMDMADNKPKVMISGEVEDTSMSVAMYHGTDRQGNDQFMSWMLETDDMEVMIGDTASHKVDRTVDEALLNQKAVVYEFSDVVQKGEPMEDAAYAAKIKMDDYKNVYFRNVDGVTYYEGYLYVGFYAEEAMNGAVPQIIFVGGQEPKEYSEQAYTHMEFFEEFESDAVTAKMTKKEAVLGDLLADAVADNLVAKKWGEYKGLSEQDKQLQYAFAAQIFADVVQMNQTEGEMNDLSAYFCNSLSYMAYYAYMGATLFLVENTVTIPAGESVTVVYEYEKTGRHDETGANPDFLDCYGYDNAIDMGTNLTFTQQVANVVEQGNIEIIEQSYGFDLASGINRVELALDAERYYMVVRVLK